MDFLKIFVFSFVFSISNAFSFDYFTSFDSFPSPDELVKLQSQENISISICCSYPTKEQIESLNP